ncbi:hypothetical protein FVE85_5136 [Porphyridium purpureum]|uniref:Uncharacterized protein n=1 Tax=Porphyridium purpureum TaxID=35688 RepID=A0A5J4Z0Z6_PORPP|nr:hypothetical protein FVE85_5136 [Porphyridium purpureum]|eukprot:POR6654..scf295_1
MDEEGTMARDGEGYAALEDEIEAQLRLVVELEDGRVVIDAGRREELRCWLQEWDARLSQQLQETMQHAAQLQESCDEERKAVDALQEQVACDQDALRMPDDLVPEVVSWQLPPRVMGLATRAEQIYWQARDARELLDAGSRETRPQSTR